MSTSEKRMHEYWRNFAEVLANIDGTLSANRKQQQEPKSYVPFDVGEIGVELNAVVNIREDRIRAEIRFHGQDAKELYQSFEANKFLIEEELGFELDWWKEPKEEDSRNYRIAVHDYIDTEDRMDWQRQHEWLAKHLSKMHPVVAQHVRETRI